MVIERMRAGFWPAPLAHCCCRPPPCRADACHAGNGRRHGNGDYYGNIFRDCSTAIAPTLEDGLDYFQPFEPPTVGDILKRTPSTAFVSDILEFDGVRLRGLDPGYTQILINGKRVPGADVDRSFWVDRIPAELVSASRWCAARRPTARATRSRARSTSCCATRSNRSVCARRSALFR